MLLVRRTFDDGREGCRWTHEALRDEDFVIVRERHRGGVFDETLVPEAGTACAALRYVLHGRLFAHAAHGGVELRAGDLLLSSMYGGAPVRSLTMDADTIQIVWRCGGPAGTALPHDARLRLSFDANARFLRLAESLSHGDRFSAIEASVDVLDVLRATGVPLDSIALRASEVTVDTRDTARAIERAFPLSSHPTSLDLARALGICEPHALRRTNAHFRRYYRCVPSWREYLRNTRLYVGAFFMGRPGARTEDVARALGFRSPTSFCHAFEAGGLRSPQRVQRDLLRA